MTLPEPAQENQNTRHLSLPSEEAPNILSTTGPLDLQRPWVIEFRVVGTATTVKARVSDAMILGRSDSTNGYIPEVDLTPFDAFSKGVSRKHAVMTIKDQRLMLRDLNSTNGTRLNNTVCTPGEEYRVRHGNELTLGTLRLQVSFAVVPAFTDTQHGETLKQTIRTLAHAAGKRLLVVESDPEVGSVFKAALENVGYKVTLVNDVIKGFGVVFQGMPDGLVLDMMEPDTNGLDLIRFVRKQKAAQHVPILAVSGALAGFQMNQALSAGADSFLGKPVSVEALLDAVAKAWEPQPLPAQMGGMTTGRLDNAQPASGIPELPENPATVALNMPPLDIPAPVEKPAPQPGAAAPSEQVKHAGNAVKPETLPPTSSSLSGEAKPTEKAVRPEALPTPPAPPTGQSRPVEKLVRPEPAASQAQELAKTTAVPPKPEPAAPKAEPLPRIKPLPPRT